jgi:hypothetical protein
MTVVLRPTALRFADLAGAEPFPMQGCEKFVLKCLSRKAQVDVFFKASKRT